MSALLLFLFVFVLSCCLNEDGGETLHLMSWNVQNLFDDVDDGTEYYEFDPSNGEWNNDLFNRKAAALSEVISAAAAGGPDIVLLQEVENENALKLLNDGYLKACNYSYAVFFPTQDSAIGCGVLSRLPVLSVKNHAVNLRGKNSGRNIAEIDFGEGAGGFKVFLNHWKSKLGGPEETEESRSASAGLLNSLIKKAAAESADLLIIAAGDFNESHDEFNRVNHSYRTAIMPAAETGETPSEETMYYVDSKAGMTADSEIGLYNPWVDAEYEGSYFYNGTWETIDQFFLNAAAFDREGLEYAGFRAAALDFNTASDGSPLRWQSGTGAGCSDHFPVILELEAVK